MRRRGLRRLLHPPVPPAVAVIQADPGVRPLLRSAERDQDQDRRAQQCRHRFEFFVKLAFEFLSAGFSLSHSLNKSLIISCFLLGIDHIRCPESLTTISLLTYGPKTNIPRFSYKYRRRIALILAAYLLCQHG
jgi:hypothetical protein